MKLQNEKLLPEDIFYNSDPIISVSHNDRKQTTQSNKENTVKKPFEQNEEKDEPHVQVQPRECHDTEKKETTREPRQIKKPQTKPHQMKEIRAQEPKVIKYKKRKITTSKS